MTARAARDVPPGEPWVFHEHRSQAVVGSTPPGTRACPICFKPIPRWVERKTCGAKNCISESRRRTGIERRAQGIAPDLHHARPSAGDANPRLVAKRRRCLGCGRDFKSEWCGNRLCGPCTMSRERRSGVGAGSPGHLRRPHPGAE